MYKNDKIFHDNEIQGHQFWLDFMVQISRPVIENLANGNLKKKMPMRYLPGMEERVEFGYLEAFGRTLLGISPWLAKTSLGGDEERIHFQYLQWTRDAIANATDPDSRDFLNFSEGPQRLVDSAFLAQALLRAYDRLWLPLEENTKEHVITALKGVRTCEPLQNNYLLFSAMIEVFLFKAGSDWRRECVDHAINQFESWYLGDGHYGDGSEFHCDYYNSYVIQPMLIDILEVLENVGEGLKLSLPTVYRRAQRYAEVQERLIGPDGTFPALGRSMTYRFGAFQLLAQLALKKKLPDTISAGRVRAALTTVLRKVRSSPTLFDEEGWLHIGTYGHQPDMAEGYIITGSLYLCTAVFLPLGLPADDEFWVSPEESWSQRTMWSDQNAYRDRYLGQTW